MATGTAPSDADSRAARPGAATVSTGGRAADGERIAAVLREEIRTGALAAGTPMREVALAARFGVSRTPVREALGRLRHDRLLDRSARGLVVHVADDDEVLQVYEVRIMLEEEVAGQAAGARRESDLSVLRGLLGRDARLTDPPDGIRISTNLEFHGAIWTASHNPVLQDLLQRLNVHLVRTPRSTLSTPERWAEARAEHAALVEAIEQQDVAAARSVARAHMSRARDIRRALLRDAAAARVLG